MEAVVAYHTQIKTWRIIITQNRMAGANHFFFVYNMVQKGFFLENSKQHGWRLSFWCMTWFKKGFFLQNSRQHGWRLSFCIYHGSKRVLSWDWLWHNKQNECLWEPYRDVSHHTPLDIFYPLKHANSSLRSVEIPKWMARRFGEHFCVKTQK